MQTKLDKIFRMTVDISNRKVTIPEAITWYVTDANIAHINCQVIDEVEDSITDIASYKLSMRVLTPGKILHEVEFSISDVNTNTFTVSMPDELIKEKGRHQCELVISYLGDILTSQPFNYNMVQSIASQLDDTIAKDSHYPLVLELEDKLNEVNNILDEQINKVIILNNDVTNAEKTRQANEAQRIADEAIRAEFYDSFSSQLEHNTNKHNNDKLFQVSIKDYDIPADKDITSILKYINENAPDLGVKLYIPSDDLYIVSDEVIFTKPIVLFSDRLPYKHNLSTTSTFGIGTKANGCLIFRGNGSEINSINVVGLDGNTNDGIRVECGRPIVRNLHVNNHGKNGLVLGWASSETSPIPININEFIVENVVAKANAEYGCVIADTTKTLSDANIGVFSMCDIMYNQLGGILLKKVGLSIFNGLHIESNEGYGIKCEQSSSNTFIRPYIEASTLNDLYFDELSSKNLVVGTRPGSGGVTDANGNNYELFTNRGTEEIPYISSFIANDIKISCKETGRWTCAVDEARTLSLKLSNTTATNGVLDLRHEKFDDGYNVAFSLNGGSLIKKITLNNKTINVGSVPANSTIDKATGVLCDAISSVTVTPMKELPTGIMASAYIKDGEIFIRCLNITNENVNINQGFVLGIISI